MRAVGARSCEAFVTFGGGDAIEYVRLFARASNIAWAAVEASSGLLRVDAVDLEGVESALRYAGFTVRPPRRWRSVSLGDIRAYAVAPAATEHERWFERLLAVFDEGVDAGALMRLEVELETGRTPRDGIR